VKAAVFDSGALIAYERGDRLVARMVRRAIDLKLPIWVPAGAVGQAWRNGRTQARLAQLLNSAAVEVVPLSDAQAREAGQLCGATNTRDVIDASVVLLAREKGVAAVTSDIDDLRRLDPDLELIRV
jgi:hypothetical protein